jgi:flagellar hook-associated protein 1 FlgK
MADIFNTAVSGLVAFQNALAVTSNNIANANTPGYSVESPSLTARQGDTASGVYIGSGVDVTSVSRAFNQFTVNQLRTANGGLGQQTAFVGIASQVDSAIGSSTNGVSTALTNFFNAWQTLASNPTSSSSQQQLLSQAQTLSTSITQTATQLNQLTGSVAGQIQSTVGSINSLSSQIAQLNYTIQVQTANAGGQPPNDLLDQRDQLLTQLSSLTNVTTSTETNGSVDVFVGSGQPIVVGGQATQLSAVPNAYDASQYDVAIGTGASRQIITNSVTGGQLGGLVSAQSQLIEPALRSLGQIATGLAVAVNSQQAQGFDQSGQFGKPLFSIAAPEALAASGNTGTASIVGNAFPATTAGVTAVGQLTGNAYTLRYSGGAWSATVVGSGQSAPVTVGTNGSGQTTLAVGGATYTLTSGTPANGDSFQLEPTAAAADSIAVSLINPAGLASASPLQTSVGATNSGVATISGAKVPNVADPSLLMPATITFSSPTTYTVTTTTAPGTTVTSAPQALAANGVITAPVVAGVAGSGGGWSVTITGTPVPGDSFNVAPNIANSGDNSNALAVAALQSSGVFAGGTIGIGAQYANLVGIVGSQTQQATNAQSAQQALVTQAQAAVTNVSGVNLDQEAANMLQWQEAYSAAAKVVTTADQMFQTLMTAIQAG